MTEIDIYDDVLAFETRQQIYNALTEIEFKVPETDRPGLPPMGRTYEFLDNHTPRAKFIMDSLMPVVYDSCGHRIKHLKLYRAYANKFKSHEDPFWHADGYGITVLYYPNMDWGEDDNGETFFWMDNLTLTGVCPYPGRLVAFSGMLKHRATTFRNGDRYSIAFKFE